MPSIPERKVLTNSSVDVINAIRNSASTYYKDYVPVATPDADGIRAVGAVIMNYPALQNEFISTLVNRIAMVLVSSKMYENPWSVFKGGLLEYGEIIEDVFVKMADPHDFDPEDAAKTLYERELPSVMTAFYIMNYQKFYPVTISEQQLRQAFLSQGGVVDLISKIIEQLYTSASYDEFMTMKYMLADRLLKGLIHVVTVPVISSANMDTIVTTIKGLSNDYTFMSDEYSLAHVDTYTNKDDQYIIINSRFEAQMSVEVLATAFNMDKVQFSGHMVLVDGFGKFNMPRLKKLLGNTPGFSEFTEAQLEALNSIPAILVSRDWFRVFDNLYEFTENYNGKSLEWNYFNHVWKTFGISPFANASAFIAGTPAITSVTVTPATATVEAGTSVQLTAKVVVTDFAPQAVTWSSSSTDATVSASGLVTVSPNAAAGKFTVTATSVYDPTKTGSAEITVS